MGIALKESGFANHIIGVDRDPDNLDKALRRRLIDEAAPLEVAISRSEVVVLAVPVNAIEDLLPRVLDLIGSQVVLDVGSTKRNILQRIRLHPQRRQYVATHPMAGTEFSGPEAALPGLFSGKCCVFCDVEASSPDAVAVVKWLYEALGMQIVYLGGGEHDVHTAYVSHISHISSFALALTVLKKEEDEKRIFELASGGFGSTVRLAKSSPQMWIPIFEQNRDTVLDVLAEHINTLAQFRSLLIKKDFKTFHQLIEQSNQIKKILP